MGKETELGNFIFSGTEPPDREYISFSTDAGEPDKKVSHVGEYTLITNNAVVWIEEGTCQHVGTVNQGLWGLLATVYEQ